MVFPVPPGERLAYFGPSRLGRRLPGIACSTEPLGPGSGEMGPSLGVPLPLVVPLVAADARVAAGTGRAAGTWLGWTGVSVCPAGVLALTMPTVSAAYVRPRHGCRCCGAGGRQCEDHTNPASRSLRRRFMKPTPSSRRSEIPSEVVQRHVRSWGKKVRVAGYLRGTGGARAGKRQVYNARVRVSLMRRGHRRDE